MQSLIAWFLRLKGFGSRAAGIVAALVVALLDAFKRGASVEQKPDARRDDDRGQHPADDSHDFPHTMN